MFLEGAIVMSVVVQSGRCFRPFTSAEYAATLSMPSALTGLIITCLIKIAHNCYKIIPPVER